MRERRIRNSIVSIVKSSTEQDSLWEALQLLPMNDLIHQGDVVVITPNWVNAKSPSTATVVGPETLRTLIKAVKTYSPKEIIVATGSGEDTVKVFHQVGYDRIIEEEQVQFIDLNYGPYMELELEHKLIPSTKINQLLARLDVLISFTQLKQHEEATMSAAVKNVMMSWPPAQIHGFPKKNLGIHKDLHGFITAMAKKLPIDLSIISADKAMIGTGPINGKAVDTQGLIIASTDPVAADTVGARLLGFKPQAIHYLYALSNAEVGETEPDKITWKGLSLEEAERIFSLAAFGKEIILDKRKS